MARCKWLIQFVRLSIILQRLPLSLVANRSTSFSTELYAFEDGILTINELTIKMKGLKAFCVLCVRSVLPRFVFSSPDETFYSEVK